MIIMDLKDGSWVGDMYQKFEAMCVEVEEVMYEDTYKYIENQVRTVGETVKKFYSDVMLDLLPPSSLDAVKVEDHLSTVVQLGDVKICEKPKVDDENQSVHAASDLLVKDVGVAAALEDRINYGSCSAICRVIKPCEHTVNDSAGEKCSKENSLSHGTEMVLSKQASAERDRECRKDSHNESVSNFPSTNAAVTTNFGEEVTFAESCDPSDESSSVHGDAISKEISDESHSADGVEISREMMEHYGGGDVVNVKKIRMLSGGRTTDLDRQLSKSTDLDLSSIKANLSTTITSIVDVDKTVEADVELSTFDIETSSSYHSCELKGCDADEQGFLVDEQLKEVKLGESCVLVEKFDNFSKSASHNVQKSYKKKIQDVLSPRRWSKSKRNQAAWYEEQSGKKLVSTSMIQMEIQKPQTSEPFESDWEIV